LRRFSAAKGDIAHWLILLIVSPSPTHVGVAAVKYDDVDMNETSRGRLTHAAEHGDLQAREKLFTTLYDRLHQMAQRELNVHAAITLSPMTLLHETFINLAQRDSAAYFQRGRFLVYASRAMRGLVIDYLRGRHAEKRGRQFDIISIPTELPLPENECRDLKRLDEALETLGKIEPRLAECVDLKFFCGFSFVDIASMRNVSERTVQRDWNKARVLLTELMAGAPVPWSLD
jgi:RNA polymerase sigma factor (TIGR02999 family)